MFNCQQQKKQRII